MSMPHIGIMQGRLSPSRNKGVQFFPFETWLEEFEKAHQLKLFDVDFIFDLDRYTENPLWNENGRIEIRKIVQETGVKVQHITADFFMRQPFFRTDKKTRLENEVVLSKLLEYANEIGALNIEIPLLDNSSLKTDDERKIFIESIHRTLEKTRNPVTITLEADLEPKTFFSLLEEINTPRVQMVYDTGNSAGSGYNPKEEIVVLARYISHVHIKDRIMGNGTVPLGTGSTRFEDVFKTLASVNFKGNFILQAARGTDGEEEQTISGYKNFVMNYINKYLS